MQSAALVRDQSNRWVSCDPSSIAEYRWPLRGGAVPIDHGYALMSAIAGIVPGIHGHECPWQVARIDGVPRRGVLEITRRSELVIRAPWEAASELQNLSGARMDVAYHVLHLGKASVSPLTPSPNLFSRLVIIKSMGHAKPDADAFWVSLAKQIAEQVRSPDGVRVALGKKRVIRLGRYTVAGWAVDIRGLSKTDSLRIQATGLGGKRHMGCGVFRASILDKYRGCGKYGLSAATAEVAQERRRCGL